jgi:two-component system, OmpR family, response regulator
MAGRPMVALICLADESGALLEEHLLRRGYEVRRIEENWEAESAFAAGGIDVAVVGDGIAPAAALDMLRAHAGAGGPLFLLVWKAAALVEKVLALELGAADVVDSGVATRELAARIGGLAARNGKGGRDLLVLENATVDLKSALVMHHSGSEEQLSAGQVALIRLFLAKPGKVLTRDDIVAAAPAENADAFDRSIDSRIVRLRRKLDTEAIVTIRGAGYRFDPPG